MERERVKEPSAEALTDYDKAMRRHDERAHRQRAGQLLVRGDEHQYEESRQGFLKHYLTPSRAETALSSWSVFEQLIKRQSGRHKHQGGIIIYVIEGAGTTETDDQVIDWQAGDLILLPIKPGGSTHQHWNRDTSKGCRWVAFRDQLVAQTIAQQIEQVSEMTEQRGPPVAGANGYVRRDWQAAVSGDQVPLITSPNQLSEFNLFDRLVALRDLQRQRLDQSTFLIRGDEPAWELNAHGRMQWYLHPCIAYTAVQTHLFYRQEIPSGSRSGVQRHGGEAIFYILAGDGFTEVDGMRHAWKAGDVMTLPVLPQGVVYRHVNTGSTAVRLIAVERNIVHTTGVDRHSGFAEVQPCPEYRDITGHAND